MSTLRKTYDRIIIDSPPVLPVSDPAVLAMHADSIVYVVKYDSTPTEQIKAGLQRLQQHRRSIAGIVLNSVDVRKAEKYGDYSYGDYYEAMDDDEGDGGRPRHATAASL